MSLQFYVTHWHIITLHLCESWHIDDSTENFISKCENIKVFGIFLHFSSLAIIVTAQSRQSPDLFHSRLNWDFPTPSPAGDCVPPSFGLVGGGGGTHSLGGEGLGGLIPTRGQTEWSKIIYMSLLFSFLKKVNVMLAVHSILWFKYM